MPLAAERSGKGVSILLAIVLTGVCLTQPVFALDPRRAMSQYVHDVWTTNNGLPQDSVNAIEQTTDGYLAQRMIDSMRDPFVVNEKQARLGVSIGIALHTAGEIEPEDLLKAADRAMYRAKVSGGNAYRFAHER